MKGILLAVVAVLVLINCAAADKGPVLWQKDVTLTQESQKAIIIHNGTEEVLVLGTEMKATAAIDLLEFIPFPSEPKVSLAQADPFDAVSRLIARKGLVFLSADRAVKGGAGGASTVPVEVRFSEKVGLHDVTTIKINDIEEFGSWLEGFFKAGGIEVPRERLSGVTLNARDYINRGYRYFVFDRVKVAEAIRFVEPLVYRFRTEKIYYPLKTSNLIGSRGAVEMVLILPGSVTDTFWQGARSIFDFSAGGAVELSSSSKLRRKDLLTINPDGEFFGPLSKIYMQVLRYRGPYTFRNDLTLDPRLLAPYAYRFESSRWMAGKEFTPSFTKEELRDLREFYCPKSGDMRYFMEMADYGLHCGDYIPGEEYEVYAAVFRARVSGIPSGRVELEGTTTKKELRGRKIKMDKDLVEDFNNKNRTSYKLESAFPDDGSLVTVRGDSSDGGFPLMSGRLFVSRVGFNRDRSRALVYVDHIAGPRSGSAWYVTLEKRKGKWEVVESFIETIY